VESAPFHWRPADAKHLAETLRRTRGTGTRQAAGLAFAVGIVALALVATGTAAGTVSALVAIVVGAMIPGMLRWGQARWIERWLRYHADCQVTAAWDDAGYSTSGCRHCAPSLVAWKQILQAIETSRYVILQTRPGPFFLPKEALDREAIQSLGAHLDRLGIRRVEAPG
jgi:hypothetical protein